GRVALRFPREPPTWLTPPLATTFGALDLGQATGPFPRGVYPHGCNMSFRVTVARELGGFSTNVGPRGLQELGHDETDLCCRIARAGGRLEYVRDAIVDHNVLPERVDPHWLLDRQQRNGESGAIFVLRNYGLRRALGWLRWHHRRYLAF